MVCHAALRYSRVVELQKRLECLRICLERSVFAPRGDLYLRVCGETHACVEALAGRMSALCGRELRFPEGPRVLNPGMLATAWGLAFYCGETRSLHADLEAFFLRLVDGHGWPLEAVAATLVTCCVGLHLVSTSKLKARLGCRWGAVLALGGLSP